MKSTLKTRAAAFLASAFMTFMVVHLIAELALPETTAVALVPAGALA